MQELFYLLANHNDDGEDGVVTTSALGIELQAGGLTDEHVQYVSRQYCDHSGGQLLFSGHQSS